MTKLPLCTGCGEPLDWVPTVSPVPTISRAYCSTACHEGDQVRRALLPKTCHECGTHIYGGSCIASTESDDPQLPGIYCDLTCYESAELGVHMRRGL